MSELSLWRKRLNSLKAASDLAIHQVKEEEVALENARQREVDVLQAQGIVQQIAEQVQEKAHRQIASVVTRCLKTVFGEDTYDFKIVFEKKRGKTEARLTFIREGQEIDPTEAAGGGVVDVTSFALRLSVLLLTQPPLRRLLVLDEPMKMVSAEYIPAVRGLLLALSQELGIQMIIVTHNKALKIGKVVEL